MYKDDEGKIRVNWKAIAFMVIFLLGIIIGWNMSENIHTKAFIIDEIADNIRNTTEDDIGWMAEAIYYENYCNGYEAMFLTGCVIKNRRDYCSWCPDTIKGVLMQKGQYSTVKKFFTEPIPPVCRALAKRILYLPNDTPENLVFQAMKPLTKNIYRKIGTDYFCIGD